MDGMTDAAHNKLSLHGLGDRFRAFAESVGESDPQAKELASHEYDSAAAALEAREAMLRVMDCPQVDPAFKERVQTFAAVRSADLRELGLSDAASLYEI